MTTILTTSRTPDVLAEIGRRLQQTRLQQNLRVADLSDRSGVSVATIHRLEAGHSTSTQNLVRVLRALGRLQALDTFLPEPAVSPRDIARRKGKRRKRASRSRNG